MMKHNSKGNVKIPIIIILSIIFNLLFITPNSFAVGTERTVSILADKDTYVYSKKPNETAVVFNYLPTGFSSINIGHSYEAYFHFTFGYNDSDYNFYVYPNNVQKAEISLYFYSINEWQEIIYTVCLIEENWEEADMTWANAPSKGPKIANLIVSSDGVYKIDVTPYIEGKTEISICVYIEMENYIEDMSYIWSSDKFFSAEDSFAYPQLLLTEDASINFITPNSSDNWQDGNIYDIEWETYGFIYEVKIELYKNSTPVDVIVDGVLNRGNIEYSVDNWRNLQGSDYRIKISDSHDELFYSFSDYFSINGYNDGNINQSINSSSIHLNLFTFLISLAVLVYLIRKRIARY